jgi:hypothetical protein
MPSAARIAAAVTAALLALAAAYGSLLMLLFLSIAWQRPDPTVGDGDPCCEHPDTWGEVALWSIPGLAFAAAVTGAGWLAFALARHALTERAIPRVGALISALAVAAAPLSLVT